LPDLGTGEEPKQLLLIDDEPTILRLYEALLQRRGFKVITASDGKKAQQLIEGNKFDCIIADILLPGLNGISLLALLREKGINIPVILITGAPDLNTAIQAIKLGAYDYLTKPVDNEQLLRVVERAVSYTCLFREKERLEAENHLYLRRLEEHNLRLEDMVRVRTKELERSVEELKLAQEKLVQSEKMASIGELSAGIAHEINNPMAYVKSNLEQIKQYASAIVSFLQKVFQEVEGLKDSSFPEIKKITTELEQNAEKLDLWYILSDCKEIIRETGEGVERVVEIIKNLKQFAHPNNDISGEAKLVDLVESAITLTWNAIKYKAELIREYKNLAPIKCYPRLLTQVFVNILVNASQAIEKQGKIWVRIFEEEGTQCAQIEDTGVGIPKNKLSKIFDPFFTTKDVNQGTGLGLSVSYGIVQKHKGKIEVESEQGKGSVFTIYLPTNFNPETHPQ